MQRAPAGPLGRRNSRCSPGGTPTRSSESVCAPRFRPPRPVTSARPASSPRTLSAAPPRRAAEGCWRCADLRVHGLRPGPEPAPDQGAGECAACRAVSAAEAGWCSASPATPGRGRARLLGLCALRRHHRRAARAAARRRAAERRQCDRNSRKRSASGPGPTAMIRAGGEMTAWRRAPLVLDGRVYGGGPPGLWHGSCGDEPPGGGPRPGTCAWGPRNPSAMRALTSPAPARVLTTGADHAGLGPRRPSPRQHGRRRGHAVPFHSILFD